MEEKVSEINSELTKARQELEKLRAERIRIRQLETQTNEKLVEVHNKLLQAGVDQRESEREVRLKETLANLQRLFPGVRGRVIDLCKPTQRKYETAVEVVLGRNVDAIVVDEEKTAIALQLKRMLQALRSLRQEPDDPFVGTYLTVFYLKVHC